MELLIIGHAGARLLAFPTSMGRYFEWEDRGMFDVMGDMIEAGQLQAYCVDSVDKESWYARDKHPGARAWRQIQYDNYLTNEVLPLSRQKNGNMFMITAGASAYPRVIDFARMAEIAKSVGALLFVDMAHIAGLVAGGVHPTPVPYADFVTTTTHKRLRGPRGGVIMCRGYASDFLFALVGEKLMVVAPVHSWLPIDAKTVPLSCARAES